MEQQKNLVTNGDISLITTRTDLNRMHAWCSKAREKFANSIDEFYQYLALYMVRQTIDQIEKDLKKRKALLKSAEKMDEQAMLCLPKVKLFWTNEKIETFFKESHKFYDYRLRTRFDREEVPAIIHVPSAVAEVLLWFHEFKEYKEK